MVHKDVIVSRLTEFINEKLGTLSTQNNIILYARPIISRIVNNQIDKVENVLNLIADKDGNVDTDNILNEFVDNLAVSQVKKHGTAVGIEMGEGKIRLNIPFSSKAVVFDSNDINELKEHLKKEHSNK